MMVAVERAPWQNPRILSTLMLVFLAGAGAGALSMRLGLHDKLHRSAAANSQMSREAVLSNFRTKLDLSGEQAQQIGLVLEDYRLYYQSLQDQLDDLRSTGKNRILAVLNPDQREKFEKMMAELAPQLTPAPPPAK
jgi:Spy/CpxP family protein refolding chaperone